jgi:hypothetical protein
MIEQLISFETAKLAKEKGFTIYETIDEFGYYHCYSLSEDYSTFNQGYLDFTGRDAVYYPCPTQGLLQKWLREIHNLNIEIFLSDTSPYNVYYYRVMQIGKYFSLSYTDNVSNTYEEALEKGLIEGLKLIKI